MNNHIYLVDVKQCHNIYTHKLFNIYAYSMHDNILSCLVLSCPFFSLNGYFTEITHIDAYASRIKRKIATISLFSLQK